MIPEWDLLRTNHGRIRNRKYEVAVLPVAAIEAHNFHLPEGQDCLHTTAIAQRCCQAAFEECASVICLPAIPYGVDCNLLDFPLTIHVSQDTLNAVVYDIVESLARHGIRKTVLLNGHGGNDYGPFIRQAQCDLDTHIFCCNWWQVGLDHYDEIFERPDDHAGEFETSVALALFPELVELENAGDGQARPFRFEALEKGYVKTSRNFSRVSDQCAVGDPSLATADKGNRYIAIVCERITRFLVELANEPIDDHFPHVPPEKAIAE